LCQFDIQHHLLSQPFFDVLAVISTVVSWSEVNCSQFDLQTSTWFGCSVVDSSRTLSYLVRRFRRKPSLRICFRMDASSRVVPVVLNSFCLFSSTWSNFLGRWYEVLLRRTSISIRPRRFARLHDPSTMSNSIDQPHINNVELHRPTVCQQCRTPSTNRISTMSNSIDQPYVNNVELHRPTVYEQCRTPSTNRMSTMSNSIDQVVSLSQWCLHQQCRTQTRRIK